MKEEIEQIKDKLENSEISEKEALNLLLGLLSVNISSLENRNCHSNTYDPSWDLGGGMG